jgi:two-component system cell cycle sensor histidine kinase PleC
MADNGKMFETFFDDMQIPRFVVQKVNDKKKGDQYVVVAANKLVLGYFDLSKEQVVGKPIADFMDAENTMHFEQSFEVCLSKDRSVTISALPGVPGKVRVYGFYISPIQSEDDDGLFLDVIGQLDVADQSIVQRERDDAILLLTSIFEVSEVGIVVTDFNGRIVRVNDSFIRTFGWSRDELINAEFVGLTTPDERELAKRNHEEFISSGIRSSGEMKLIRKDGSVANALFTTATLELSQKRRFQVTTIMDITLRKQMEQSLRMAKDQADAANRAKSVFLANMSHELRTPMNAIIGFSEMMIKETFGPLGHDKYLEYLNDVHGSAQHLLEIINEVLDMSKIEAGRIEMDEGEVELPELIASVMRMMGSRAFGSDVSLKSDISETLPNLQGDGRLVRQVLINLVTNAVKFSKSGDTVTVSAYVLDDGRLQIKVTDEGVGIPKDKIKQAMEPFGQVTDRAENANFQGTGLGLPLAKAMVDLHDGTLRLDSEINQGTTVYVNFPSYRIIPRQQNASSETVSAEIH